MTVVEIALDEGITGLDAEAVRQSVARTARLHPPAGFAGTTDDQGASVARASSAGTSPTPTSSSTAA